jgi:hypothetical protein
MIRVNNDGDRFICYSIESTEKGGRINGGYFRDVFASRRGAEEHKRLDSTEINKVMVLFFEEWVELINSGFLLLWFYEPVLAW